MKKDLAILALGLLLILLVGLAIVGGRMLSRHSRTGTATFSSGKPISHLEQDQSR